MPKLKKSKKKSVKPSILWDKPGPHDWFYMPTASLEREGLMDAAKAVLEVLDKSGPILSKYVRKIGPGVVVIRRGPDDETSAEDVKDMIKTIASALEGDPKHTYQRMALVGDEAGLVVGAYIGKRDGIIVKLDIKAGEILGFDKKDCICEVPLAELAKSWCIADGSASIKEPIDQFLMTFGDNPSEIVDGATRAKEAAAAALAEKERKEREEYIRTREGEYGTTSWGAW